MSSVRGFYFRSRIQLAILFVAASFSSLSVCARAHNTVFLHNRVIGLSTNEITQNGTLPQASYGYNPQRDNGVAPLYARVPAKDSAGNPTSDYRYTYYHNDHLGTPQRLTDQAGNLLWSAQYDACGKAVVRTTASAQLATINPLRQPDQYLDAETGLHYNDRRYYDAYTGRCVSRDPIGFKGGINIYGLEIDG